MIFCVHPTTANLRHDSTSTATSPPCPSTRTKSHSRRNPPNRSSHLHSLHRSTARPTFPPILLFHIVASPSKPPLHFSQQPPRTTSHHQQCFVFHHFSRTSVHTTHTHTASLSNSNIFAHFRRNPNFFPNAARHQDPPPSPPVAPLPAQQLQLLAPPTLPAPKFQTAAAPL